MNKTLSCPGCGTGMAKVKAPDMTYDACPKCGGSFFDKGELNALATGMAGDIEVSCLDGVAPTDGAPARRCPRCADTGMQKVALLSCLEMALDFCPQCQGFYLDKGEAADMEAELHRIMHSGKGMEYRGEIDGRLVRIDNAGGTALVPVELGLANETVPTVSIIITVFLKKPLGLSLRITSEKWTDRLRKLVHRFHGQDITVGDAGLDSAYLVQGTDEAKIQALLNHPETKSILVEFHRKPPKIVSLPGKLTVLDDRVQYAEGPYSGEVNQIRYDGTQDPAGVLGRLTKLAAMLERG